MSIRKTFWGFLAVLAASVLGATLTREEFYYRVSYLISFLILASFGWAFFSIKGIQVNRFARVTRQQVGQLFDETIEVENKYSLVRLWLEVRDKTPLPGSSGSRVLSWIQGNSIRSYSVYTLLIQRGDFSLGPTIISSGDPFGLFAFKKVIPGEKTLLVLPFSVDLKSFPFPSGLLPGGRALRRRSLEVTPHAAGVREYVYGDSLNRIHWPTTARRDKLMVKEFDQDPQADVWVFLDSCQNGHIQSNDPMDVPKPGLKWFWWSQREEFRLFPSTYEYSVSAVASIVKYFIHQGQSVGFVSVGQLYVNLPAERGERQLGKVLETLAFLKSDGQLSLQGLVESQVGYLPRGSVVVLVTPSVRDDVVLAVDGLILREIRPIVVVIDPHSFGSPSRSESLIEKLSSRGITLVVVKKDANLKEALEENFTS
jgi:Uncharacterized conserved protein (some members contain a von Willebrand factor type A (vWA) domain)